MVRDAISDLPSSVELALPMPPLLKRRKFRGDFEDEEYKGRSCLREGAGRGILEYLVKWKNYMGTIYSHL